VQGVEAAGVATFLLLGTARGSPSQGGMEWATAAVGGAVPRQSVAAASCGQAQLWGTAHGSLQQDRRRGSTATGVARWYGPGLESRRRLARAES